MSVTEFDADRPPEQPRRRGGKRRRRRRDLSQVGMGDGSR